MGKNGNEPIELSELGPLKILLKGAGLAFLGLALTKGSQYIFRLLIAREGAELYGVFSLGFTIFSIAGMLSFLGMTTGLYRYLPKERAGGRMDGIASFLKSALQIASVTSILLLLLMFFLSDWIAQSMFHDGRVSIVIKILAIGLPFYAFTGLFLAVINSFFKNQYDVVSKTIGESFIRLILAAFAILLGYGLLGVSVAYLISIFATFLLSFYFMEKRVFPFFGKAYKAKPRHFELLKFSIPLMLSGVVFLFINWTDSILLGIYRSVSEVGVYNTALPTAGLLLMFPNALTTLLAPLVSDLLAKKKRFELGRTYQTANKWIFLLNLPALLVMALFPSQALTILFGQEYAKAGPSLVILSVANLFYSLTLSATFVLSSAGRSKDLLINSLIAAVMSIALNLALIPAYGISGAALGTGISLLAYGAISAYQVKRLIGFWPMAKTTFRILAAGTVTLAIPLVASIYLDVGGSLVNLALIGIATIAAYALMLFALKAFDPLDVKMVEAIEGKLSIELGPIKSLMK
ncbi:MAG: flippase [Candidatus Micrarchaeota archaeon]